MKTRIPQTLALTLALALVPQAIVLAQTTQPPRPTDEETVTLDTFTVDVDRDRGYIAVDALAGGRTNTPIKLTPAAMSSLTRTFIEDLGIQNVREALRWTGNVVPQDPLAGKGFGGAAFHSWSFNFRGAGAGQQGGPGPTRNYFTFFENADAYNIERVEFTRGPNGILFGLGTVGGTLSTYTKVPRLDKNFISPAVIADDHGSLRFEADYNVVTSEKSAVRLNALYDEPRGWREGDEGEKKAVTLAVLYKLTPRTTLRLEGEVARNEQTLFASTIKDKFSAWDGVTASETWGAEPTGGTSPTVKIGAAGAWGDWLNVLPVYVPNLGDKGLMPWGLWTNDADPANPGQTVRTYHGGYATASPLSDANQALPVAPYRGWYPDEILINGTPTSMANAPVRPGEDWTWGSGLQTNDYEDFTAFLDHRFNDNFDLQLSFFTYDTETIAQNYEDTAGASVDINRQLPDGSPNPNFGKTFADFFVSKQTQERSVDEYRAQLNYKYDGQLFGHGFKQILAASASYRVTKISARQYLLQVKDSPWGFTAPGDWVHNMVWGRIYLDDPNHFPSVPDSIGGYETAFLPKQDGYWFDFDDEFKLTSYALFSNTRLFDDRLSIALGARRDSYDEHLVSLWRGPNLTNDIDDESDSGTTYTAGAIYYFGWLGVFGNYSESLLPPNAGSQPYIDGSRPRPEENEGYDVGIRVSTNDGKYYASLSYYDSTSNSRNVENPVPIRGVWQAYNVARGETQDSGLGSIAYSDTQALEATGYEFEITANPTDNLRLQASFAKPDTEITDFYPMTRAHVAENLAAWNAQLDATTDPTHRSNLETAIDAALDKLAQSTGGNPQEKQVDYTASFFANYTFPDSVLKGFSVGAGGTFIGRTYQLTGDAGPQYGDSIRSYDAVIAYETEFGRVRARFALNVDNIFDYDDPIVSGYHSSYTDSTGLRIREAYYFQNPRTFRLSARFTF